MGMFLGKIYVETPKHEVVKKGQLFEIRQYPPCIVAEVSYDASTMRGGRDGGFLMLAKFIGAFGSPQNVKPAASGGDDSHEENSGQKIAMTAPVITMSPEKIAMTAPVITMSPEKIAMTAPVITKTEEGAAAAGAHGDGAEKKHTSMTTMQFILPAEYSIDSIPKPTDDQVKVKEVPGRCMAAITFSGSANESLTQKKLEELRNALAEEASGYKIAGEHMLARYNDPFTPWFLRTNEVLVPVEKVDGGVEEAR